MTQLRDLISRPIDYGEFRNKNTPFFVLDTSSIVAITQHEWWIVNFENVVGHNRGICAVVLPEVQHELDGLYRKNKLDDKGLVTLSVPLEKIMEVLYSKKFDFRSIPPDNASIADLKSSVIDVELRHINRRMEPENNLAYARMEPYLSRTDVLVFYSALKLASNGIDTYIYTSDSGLTQMADHHNSITKTNPIKYISPFNAKKSWYADLDENFLITNEVLAQLKNLTPKTSFRHYMGVVENYGWNAEFTNDIALSVCRSKVPSQKPKKINGVTYYPLVVSGQNDDDDSRRTNLNYRSLGYEYIFETVPDNPPAIFFYRTNRAYSSSEGDMSQFLKCPNSRINATFLYRKNPELQKLSELIKKQ